MNKYQLLGLMLYALGMYLSFIPPAYEKTIYWYGIICVVLIVSGFSLVMLS